jgi:hypothetical protein
MNNQNLDDNIPVLNDLIEKGIEITMSDLGFEDFESPEIGSSPGAIENSPTRPHNDLPEDQPTLSNTEMAILDREIRSLIDDKMDEAMFEIRKLIQSRLGKQS